MKTINLKHSLATQLDTMSVSFANARPNYIPDGDG
jgi:hypothetical protein